MSFDEQSILADIASDYQTAFRGLASADRINEALENFEEEPVFSSGNSTKEAAESDIDELDNVYSSIEDIKSGNKSLVYDERTLRRMSEDVGPYHNIPNSLDKSIISDEPYLIRSDGRVEFLKKGTVNGKEGVYHMTIQDGIVKHKLFTPQNDWSRFAKRWGLPDYDLID